MWRSEKNRESLFMLWLSHADLSSIWQIFLISFDFENLVKLKEDQVCLARMSTKLHGFFPSSEVRVENNRESLFTL